MDFCISSRTEKSSSVLAVMRSCCRGYCYHQRVIASAFLTTAISCGPHSLLYSLTTLSVKVNSTGHGHQNS